MRKDTEEEDGLVRKGFLWEFEEREDTELGDGEHVVHFDGEYRGCEMKVKVVNGKREGEAIVWKKGERYWRLTYRNGIVDGVVEKMGKYGNVKLRGMLVKGVERGLFEEYKFGIVFWRGYYRNGEKYSEVVDSERGGRWCEERREGSGELLSIAEYDDVLKYKNGRCLEYENGKWVGEWLYENGVRMKHICDDRNGILTCYDINGRERSVIGWERQLGLLSKRIDPSFEQFSNTDSMIVYDIEIGCSFGVMRVNEKCFLIGWSKDMNRVSLVDLNRKEMIMYENGEQVDVHCGNGVIDLNVNGRRWEGGLNNGKPFGYGVLFDEEGREEYEGFMMDGLKICYGVEYFSDIERVMYEGCFYDSSRFGKGILYDRNGIIEYDGLWKNGQPYSDQFDGKTIDNRTESIDIENNSFKGMDSFTPPFFLHSFKRIVIGNWCFEKVRVFELAGLSELESVEIGKKSFRIGGNERKHGVCRIVNCPELESIQIGNNSFSDYRSFELNNLPSLQSLVIGEYCFYHAPSFSLTGLID